MDWNIFSLDLKYFPSWVLLLVTVAGGQVPGRRRGVTRTEYISNSDQKYFKAWSLILHVMLSMQRVSRGSHGCNSDYRTLRDGMIFWILKRCIIRFESISRFPFIELDSLTQTRVLTMNSVDNEMFQDRHMCSVDLVRVWHLNIMSIWLEWNS